MTTYNVTFEDLFNWLDGKIKEKNWNLFIFDKKYEVDIFKYYNDLEDCLNYRFTIYTDQIKNGDEFPHSIVFNLYDEKVDDESGEVTPGYIISPKCTFAFFREDIIPLLMISPVAIYLNTIIYLLVHDAYAVYPDITNAEISLDQK